MGQLANQIARGRVTVGAPIGAESVDTASGSEVVDREVKEFTLTTNEIRGVADTYLGQEGTTTTTTRCVFVGGSGAQKSSIIKNAVIVAIQQMGLPVPDLRGTQRLSMNAAERDQLINRAMNNALSAFGTLGDIKLVVNGRVARVPSFCT